MLHFIHKIRNFLPWIPVANVILFFVQYSSLQKVDRPVKIRAGMICFGVIGASAILQLCITIAIPNIKQFSGMIISYLVLVVLNLKLISLQAQSNEDGTRHKIANKRKMIRYVAVTGCIIIVMLIGVVVFQNSLMHIADQNGENDTSLAVISRNEILEGKHCTVFAHTQTASGSSSQTGPQYDDIDKDAVSHTFGKLSGVYTVHATKADVQILKLTISSTIQSGNMELAIIVDGEYRCSVPISQTAQITLENIRDKTVLVRLAGESAKAEISINRSYVE